MAGGFWDRYRAGQGRVARLNRSNMAARTLEGRGSEERLARVRSKFRKVVGAPPRRAADRAKLGIGLWLIAWATFVGIAAAVVISQFEVDRDLVSNLQHIASVPNCAAARMVGVAEARVGEPGYWSGHDRDHDGIACEPIPEWKR